MKRFASLLLALLLLCGCTGTASERSGAEEPKTIAVLLKAMDNPHWQEMRKGILDTASARNVDVILLYPENELDTRQQTLIFRDILDQKPDALLWAPCDSSLGPQMKALADEAGVPLFIVDTRASGVDLPYIGADNRLIGQLAAQYMVENAGYKGQFAVIAGSQDQLCHTERAQGFYDTMKKYRDCDVVDICYSQNGYGFNMAMDMTQDLLDQYPDLTGIFCTSGVMGLGCAEQIKANYRQNQILVVTQDTQSDVLSAVSTGVISAMITQDGYEAGYLAIDAILKSLSGQETPQNIYLSAELLTWRNVDDFMKDYLQRRDQHD
ncbi:MAG: sugar ABC transporter substrate-binding protein [Butyricicoccus sp.]